MSTRVVNSTTERLTLKSRSNIWLYFPPGVLFIALGVAGIWWAGYTAKIQVQNGRLSYARDYFGFWRTFEQSWELNKIEKISVESVEFGIYASLEIFVMSPNGRCQLDLPASDGNQKKAIADELERARRGERRLYTRASSAWVPMSIMATACVGGGIVCWCLMETVTLDANAATQLVRIRRRRWLWPFATAISLRLDCLTSLQRQDVPWKTSSGYKVCYHLVFEDDDGGLQTLTSTPLFTEHSSAVFLSLVNTWLKQNLHRRLRRRSAR
ncbi:MAG: hypothetical protein JNL67_14365 [Planctomycetaceae bacterium]|nr:hypothetical protein [Planctomycetaceae bacterium]